MFFLAWVPMLWRNQVAFSPLFYTKRECIIVTLLANYWVNQQKEADDPSLAVNENSDEASGECQIRQCSSQ